MAETPISTPPTVAPAPAATDPSAQLDQQLQQLMQHAMQRRTEVPVPKPQPQERQQFMQGPATTHAEGNQMFFHNLGALVGNAAQAHKEQQIKKATGVLQTLHDAWDSAQESAGGDQQKAKQIFTQLPQVQNVVGDPKTRKQLEKMFQFDAMDPTKNNTVYHEAGKRVGAAAKIKEKMQAIQQALTAHKQQQQQPAGDPNAARLPGQLGQGGQLDQKPSDPLPAAIADRARLAPADTKTAVAIAAAESRIAAADARANQLQTQMIEKQREFDQNQTRLQQAAGLKDEEFKKNQERLDQSHQDLLDYRKQLLSMQKQRINQMVKNTDLRRIITGINYDPDLLKPGEAEAFGMQVDENGKLIPARSPLSATAQTKNAAQQAGVMDGLIDETLNELKSPTLQAALGPYQGRISEIIQGKVGYNVPEFAALRTLGSFDASGMLKLHFGARGGGQQYDKFHNLIDTGKMDVASLNEALNAMNTVVKTYKGEVKTTRGTATGTSGVGTGGQGGGTIAFSANGRTYNIPKDQVAAFKKDFPNATTVK